MRNVHTAPIAALALLFHTGTIQAQGFQWSTTGGAAGISNSYLGAMDIARDPSGNLYLFNDANTAQQCQGDTVQPLGGGGSLNTFIHKFDADGILQWIRPVGSQFQPFSIECDEAGSIYLLGRSLVGNIFLEDTVLSVTANRNHLLKFAPNGDLIWHHDTGMPLTGGFSRTTLLHQAAGRLYFQSSNLSIACIDTSGAPIGTFSATSYVPQTALQNLWFKSAIGLSNGDVVVAGEHRGELAFGSNPSLPGDPNAAALNRYFFLRLGPELDTLHWFSSHGSFRDRLQYDIPLIRDGADHVYASVTLNPNTPIVFGPDQITSTLGNGLDAIVKMDASGTPLWMRALPNTSNSAYAFGLTWKDDDSGLLACGQFTANITLGSITLTPGNTGRGFIAEVAPDGTFVTGYASGTPGTPPGPVQSWGQALASNGGGEYYITGFLNTLSNWELSCTPVVADRGFFLGAFTAVPDSVPTPTITQSGDSLVATPAFGGDIEWFLDGSAIPGASGESISISANGNYSVSYTNSTGCTGTATSSTFLVTTLGLAHTADISGVLLMPNPTEGLLRVSGLSDNSIIRIIDTTGRTLLTHRSSGAVLVLDVSTLPCGPYLVRIESADATNTFRVVKQ